MPLSIRRDDFDADWRYHSAVLERLRAKAEHHTPGKWDPHAWNQVLHPTELDALLVLSFVASWENNGRFVDTVGWYQNEFEQVELAFRRLGFKVAAVLMSRALELHAWQAQAATPAESAAAEIEKEIDRINQAATSDVSEERLTSAISDLAADFDV